MDPEESVREPFQPEQEPNWSALYPLIGRNLVLLQSIEHGIKELIACSTVRATRASHAGIRTVSLDLGKRRDALKMQTLGNLVGRLVEEVHEDYESDDEAPASSKADGIVLAFRHIFDRAEDKEIWRQRLQTLVEGRNRLAHGLVPRGPADGSVSRSELRTFLDQQYEDALGVCRELRRTWDSFLSMRQDLNAEEIVRLIFVEAPRLELIHHLRQAAAARGTEAGWLSLGEVLREVPALAKVIPSLLKAYDVPSVSVLIEQQEGFELREASDGGRRMTQYRVVA